MSDQILAIYKNVLKPRGPAVDAGDLVLTTERLCFVQLAAWEPNNNANPLRTAIAGTVGGFGAALVSHVHSVRSQSPEIASLLARADKKRDLLWGMNVEERLSATKSRWLIPIGEITVGKSSDGAGVSVKDKRVGALSASNLNSFELYLTELPQTSAIGSTSEEQREADLQAILLTWKSHQMSAQTVEGYTANFPAPQLFLDALKTGTFQKEKLQESAMLGDNDYMTRLEPVFKAQAYQDQCRIIRSLCDLSASNLALLLQGQLLVLLREQFKTAIQKEVPNWCGKIGVPLSIILIISAVAGFLLAKPGWADRANDSDPFATTALGSLFLLFFSGAAALTWLTSFTRLKGVRKRLQEQGVEPLAVEAELRGTAKAAVDAECSISLEELRAAFSNDSAKEQFFKKVYARPWKMKRVIFQRFHNIVEPSLRRALADPINTEARRRNRSGVIGLICGLVAGTITWLIYASIPPHGYGHGPDAPDAITVLVVALFWLACGIATPVLLISSILAFVAFSRYNRVAKSLSR